MPPVEKHKINVWIPESLWKQIESLGYDSPTKATIAAFEALALREEKESNQEALGRSMEEKLPELEKCIQYLENSTREKNTEILRLQKVIQEAPDRAELAELKGNHTGLQRLLEEKDKRIEDLTREVSRLDMFAHYFKNVEVKQIEAHATEKVKTWWKFW